MSDDIPDLPINLAIKKTVPLDDPSRALDAAIAKAPGKEGTFKWLMTNVVNDACHRYEGTNGYNGTNDASEAAINAWEYVVDKEVRNDPQVSDILKADIQQAVVNALKEDN
jgi:hypothetical protein